MISHAGASLKQSASEGKLRGSLAKSNELNDPFSDSVHLNVSHVADWLPAWLGND
jgi:hypothetical protein